MYRATCRCCPWDKNDNVVFAPGAKTTFCSIHSTQTAVLWCSLRQHTTITFFRAVQHSTVECCALQCCTQLHRAAVYCALLIGWLNVQYSAVQYRSELLFLLHGANTTFRSILHDTAQHSTAQYIQQKQKHIDALCYCARRYSTLLYCAV